MDWILYFIVLILSLILSVLIGIRGDLVAFHQSFKTIAQYKIDQERG